MHRLSELLAAIYGRNQFYTRKLDAAGIRVDALRFPDDLAKLPLTTKTELAEDQAANSPWGTALTEPLEQVHPLLPDVLDDRTAAAVDRHE